MMTVSLVLVFIMAVSQLNLLVISHLYYKDYKVEFNVSVGPCLNSDSVE